MSCVTGYECMKTKIGGYVVVFLHHPSYFTEERKSPHREIPDRHSIQRQWEDYQKKRWDNWNYSDGEEEFALYSPFELFCEDKGYSSEPHCYEIKNSGLKELITFLPWLSLTYIKHKDHVVINPVQGQNIGDDVDCIVRYDSERTFKSKLSNFVSLHFRTDSGISKTGRLLWDGNCKRKSKWVKHHGKFPVRELREYMDRTLGLDG